MQKKSLYANKSEVTHCKYKLLHPLIFSRLRKATGPPLPLSPANFLAVVAPLPRSISRHNRFALKNIKLPCNDSKLETGQSHVVLMMSLFVDMYVSSLSIFFPFLYVIFKEKNIIFILKFIIFFIKTYYIIVKKLLITRGKKEKKDS